MSERGDRGWTAAAAEDTATQEQQHARWRNTYSEHGLHARHRARVPITDGLIEGSGFLQHVEGRAVVWSEKRCRSEGIGDGRPPPLKTQRRKSSNLRDGGTRTTNMACMPVTELVSQLDKSG